LHLFNFFTFFFNPPDLNPHSPVRCNQEEFFSTAITKKSRSQCAAQYVVNPENLYTILKNVELRKSDTYQEAVQVMPQHTSLKLRVNEAFNMDFYYEQAIDYPVDLYYLMDLSKSMVTTRRSCQPLATFWRTL